MPTRRNFLRTFFRQVFLVLLVLVVAILAFRNGVNVSDRGDIPNDAFLMQLYYAIGLFALGGMDLGMPTGGPRVWQMALLATYFLAPALTAATVIEGLWRAIWLRLVDKWPWRDHIVLAGGGRVARAVVAECLRAFPGTRILVVEKRVTDSMLSHFGPLKRVYLIGGDTTEPSTVEALRIGHARALMLLTNDELANVELAVQSEAHFGGENGLPMLVRVADLDLTDRANRMLAREGRQPCVNIHKAVAEKICRDSIDYMKENEGRENLVFTGFGRFGQTYLRQFMKVRGTEHIDSIAIIDKDAELAWQRFFDGLSRDQRSQISDIPVHRQSGLQEDPRVWAPILSGTGGGERPLTNLVVLFGTNDDPSNLKAAMRVRDQSPEAYVMVRTFGASSFARQIGAEMNLEIVDIAQELQVQIKAWVGEIRKQGPRG
jgi:hypothetical protein